MFGESLLVAPVFREDGQVTFYLPRGTWTHLLSGEKREGGTWLTEKYDFMSLPLYVRPGTVLPMGGQDDRPDYDYTEKLQLHVFQLPEGGRVQVTVPDLKGEPKAVYTVEMKNGKPEVVSDCPNPCTVILHS